MDSLCNDGIRRRVMLEVMKWLQPRDVLLTAEEVCKEWQRLAYEEELWSGYLPVEMRVQGQVSREVYRFDLYRPNYIPFLVESRVYRIKPSAWTAELVISDPRLCFKDGTRLFFLHNNDLLISGGWQVSNNFLLSNRLGTIEPFIDFPTDKSHHGLAEVAKVVYCFGGNSSGVGGPQATLVLRNQWNYTSDMKHERVNFSPVAVGSLVFLAGGLHASIEIYDTLSDSFEDLDIVLPVISASSAVLYGQVITLLSPHHKSFLATPTRQVVISSSLEIWWRGASDLVPIVIKDRSYHLVTLNSTANVYIFDHSVGCLSRVAVNLWEEA